MRNRRFVFSLAVSLALAACGGSSAVPDAQTPGTVDAKAQTPDAPQAPDAQAPIALKFQGFLGTGDPIQEALEEWAKKAEEMSGGRLDIEVLPVNAVVGGGALHTTVSEGTKLDGALTVPANSFALSRSMGLFGTGPMFGLDGVGLLGWMRYGGGQALYQQLLDKLGLNIVSFFMGPLPTQPMGWFPRPVTKLDDLRGLKFRTIGHSLRLFNLLGMEAINLPGAQVLAALQDGTLDAAEFNNPTSDKLFGFPTVRPVYMLQSNHQPGEVLELIINKTRFNALPADLQAIIRYAALAQSAEFELRMMDRNSTDLKAIVAAGIQVLQTPQEILDAQLSFWDQIATEESADTFAATVLQSQKEWAKRVVPLRNKVVIDISPAAAHYFPNE